MAFASYTTSWTRPILFQPRSVDGSSLCFSFDVRHDPVELTGWIGPELDAVTSVRHVRCPVVRLADLSSIRRGMGSTRRIDACDRGCLPLLVYLQSPSRP